MIELFIALIVSICCFVGIILLTQYLFNRIEGRRFKREYDLVKCYEKSIRQVIDLEQERKARRSGN